MRSCWRGGASTPACTSHNSASGRRGECGGSGRQQADPRDGGALPLVAGLRPAAVGGAAGRAGGHAPEGGAGRPQAVADETARRSRPARSALAGGDRGGGASATGRGNEGATAGLVRGR